MSAVSENALQLLAAASDDPRLSSGAVENIRIWLTEPRYAEYVSEIHRHLEEGLIQELDDAFWTIIPFGTGGRRGRMYPIGCNAINDRTIGESAQGLATYIKNAGIEGPLSCAIAYDTRHRSRHFAELCASIMVANGFHVCLLDDHRSTPELSFLVRCQNCSCGIMVTASHNPPSDNAVKVYWSNGAQVLPPNDKGIIEQVMKTAAIEKVDFQEASASGKVETVTETTDTAYHAAVLEQRFDGPREAKIIYSPLHGVGENSVAACLAGDGFSDVEIYGPHREKSGDFPNVPEHVSNPENPAVFDAMIQRGQEIGADLILATDPDCDRMGAAAPLTTDTSGDWATFNGNQLGALLCDYVLEQRKAAGTLSDESYIVTTLVTTQLLRRVAESYGVTAFIDQLVGFKWICGRMDAEGPENFVFGSEESHGYLVGQYARDKDGAVACMLMAELAAQCKADGLSIHQRLEKLQHKLGCHCERLLNVRMEGSEGMEEMKKLMHRLRSNPPSQLGGLKIARVRDYATNEVFAPPAGERSPLEGPTDNLVILDTEAEGNYIAIRPSGTEPKVKFYLFAFDTVPSGSNVATVTAALQQRLDTIENDVRTYAKN